MVNQTLARRYAIAVSSLAGESNAADAVGDDLRVVAAALSAPGRIHDFFVAPVISRPDKERVLAQAFQEKIHPIALHTLLLLVRKRRETLLPALVDEYASLQRAAQGRQRVTLTSARPIDRDEYAKLVRRLERLYHTKFDVTQVLDANLIGGLRIMMGDRRIDDSIAGRLDALARELAASA